MEKLGYLLEKVLNYINDSQSDIDFTKTCEQIIKEEYTEDLDNLLEKTLCCIDDPEIDMEEVMGSIKISEQILEEENKKIEEIRLKSWLESFSDGFIFFRGDV
jgi:hypothetical protein